MSGGVDSSVAAVLLQKRGYEVIGVTMQIWQESHPDPRHGGCCSLGAVEDARRVARRLGIPHYVLNFRRVFADTVIRDFIHEYRRGRTPNPCVQCNRFVKFDALLKKADELGCDYIATGHYARVRYNPHTGRWNLLRAVNKDKDQSYVLYMLNQEQLRRSLFPLGTLPSKEQTRQIAREMGLWTADKPDSQEICFVAHLGGYHQFLREVTPDAFKPGEIRDVHGRVLGMHQGIALYTIGQRRRLNIPSPVPMYVLRILPEENAIIVGTEDQLYEREMWVGDVVWSSIPELTKPLKVMAKIRYNMPAAPAKVFPTEREDQVRVVFDQPVRAITPGQIAVFYRGETVVGGGTILAPNQIEVDSETTEQAVKRALQRVQPFMLEGAIE
ncbi:tRNA (5-methylaminomethyl-2-thiouridylate)-methyltransferase [Armatimonadetes bacterium GBS]|nr:tRNA-specific 2-thiouridylase MnmA [bacterium HR14]GIV14199.1 MAG: tRNA-specific 2-thiouridylase MnmA [Fimbriimonadales bacterium]CUU02882.1 tRNA (5-methylaminomethyl-2-thiouridylate)-methyltransferase [Armatimonadetes bacterium GBS]CUU38756.1 tRNA (5-methylaminomethyl-2-thiouridylate)-methyltransferase [Armatimonadetes bacterium GXS]